jgi:hypothetical protein
MDRSQFRKNLFTDSDFSAPAHFGMTETNERSLANVGVTTPEHNCIHRFPSPPAGFLSVVLAVIISSYVSENTGYVSSRSLIELKQVVSTAQ